MSTAPVWQSSDEQLLAELGELAPQVEAELAPRRSALSPLAAPRPRTDVEVDSRTADQRAADALIELAERALDSGALPTEGGQRAPRW